MKFWRCYITRETQRVCRLLWFVRVERTRVLLHQFSFWILEEAWESSSTMQLPPPENCLRRSESGEPKPSALATRLVRHFSPLIPLSHGYLSLSLSLNRFKHFTRFELTWSCVFLCISELQIKIQLDLVVELLVMLSWFMVFALVLILDFMIRLNWIRAYSSALTCAICIYIFV